MKQTLLLLAFTICGLTSFAQTSINDVAYSDGTTYAHENEFSVAGGGEAIFVPVADFDAENAYWDLSTRTGLEFQFTCSSADLDKSFPLRLVVVNPDDNSALSVIKDVTFTTETQTISFELSETEFNGATKLWGIKVNWGASAFTDPIAINYINLMGGTAAVGSKKFNQDPNRLVDVYSITGKAVRKAVKFAEATTGLEKGLYIIEKEKIYIMK